MSRHPGRRRQWSKLARGLATISAVIGSSSDLRAADRGPSRPVHVALAWTRSSGAEPCISPEEMVARTRERTSSDTRVTLDRAGADFLVVGRIARSGEGFRTELVLRDAVGRPLGERSFESPARSCRALDDSLTLALLLLVETPPVRAAARGEGHDEREELAPPLRTEVAPDQRVRPVRLPPQKENWEIDLGIGASGVLGLTPEPTVGPTVFGMVRPPRFVPIVLRGALYPFGVERPTIPGEGISVLGGVAGAELCPFGWRRMATEVLGCGGAHLGVLRADPLGPRSNSGELFFVALPLRVEVRARVDALEPYAAVSGRFVPTSPTFVYRAENGEDRTSFRVPWATLELDLGLAWRVSP